MKKALFLSMGLAFAFLASASPPTFAVDSEPDTGSDVVINTSGPAATEYIAIQALDEGGNNVISSASYGRETVPEPSDHMVCNVYFHLNPMMMTVNGALPLAAVKDPERSPYNVIMTGPALNKSSTGLAASTATAPANLRHSMAWVTSYLSGSLRG